MPASRSSRNRHRHLVRKQTAHSRPFWLPAISYYVLTGAISGVVFFLIWGILFEGDEETPWVPAGVAAGLMMIAAVFVREVVLRNARSKYIAARKMLDRNISRTKAYSRERSAGRKLGLREHELMISHIRKKSEAARVLVELAEGHREVFAICDEYLELTRRELNRTDVNSPRFLAIRKGRARIKRLHKYHLLAWTEIESKNLTRRARSLQDTHEKINTAEQAVEILEEAIRHYPTESRLVESVGALREFISAVDVAGRIKEAERFEAEGNPRSAADEYERVLTNLPFEHFGEEERKLLTDNLERKIRELRDR